MVAATQAEIVKIRSWPATVATLSLTAGLTIAFSPVVGYSLRDSLDRYGQVGGSAISPADAGFEALRYGQLGLIVFGVLAVTQEYTAGMIRASLTAVPPRAIFYAGKLAAITLSALVVAVPTGALSFIATQAGLGHHGVSPLAADVPRALAGSVLYLLLVCLLASGLAAIVRSAVVALAILFPLFFVVPTLVEAFGAADGFARYLPTTAGAQLMSVDSSSATALGPGVGGLVLGLWAVVALAGGYLLLRYRGA